MTQPPWLTDAMVEAAARLKLSIDEPFGTRSTGGRGMEEVTLVASADLRALLTLASTPLGELMAAAVEYEAAASSKVPRGFHARCVRASMRLEIKARAFASSLPVET